MNAVVVIPTPTQPSETDPATAAVLSAVLGAVPHGIAVTDLDGRLAHANGALARRLGYPAPELDALTLAHLLHPDDVDDRLTGDVARRVAVLRWRHADGQYRPARTTVAPVHHHETGVTHRFVYTVED
ncbi:MAG TPA: PAS domain-containing protein, partial [Kineosporiaceae bacterium]